MGNLEYMWEGLQGIRRAKLAMEDIRAIWRDSFADAFEDEGLHR